MASPFNRGVSSSAEGELAIDETASTVILAPNLCVVPDLSVAVQEGDEYVREVLNDLRGEGKAAGHHVLGGETYDNNSFLDFMSGIRVRDAESEGWTFADALLCANLAVETLTEGDVVTSHLPTC